MAPVLQAAWKPSSMIWGSLRACVGLHRVKELAHVPQSLPAALHRSWICWVILVVWGFVLFRFGFFPVCLFVCFTQSMVWIIQQKVLLLLPKTNTHFILEPKRIETIELKWRAVDAEMGSAAHASRRSGRGQELAQHGAMGQPEGAGSICSFPSSVLCF